MLAFSLFLGAATLAPVQALLAESVIVAQTSSDCQAQFDALGAAVQSATFSGKNADKERAGLLRALDGARTTLSAGKYADTLKKLDDFRIKVEDLKASQKIDASDADALLAATAQAVECVQALGSAPA